MKWLLALLLLFPAGAALAESFVARWVSVLDGDTVLVRREAGGRPMKVRLADIDAPEKEQDFGDAAKQSLAKMLSGRQVRVDPVAVDMYGRLVARLYIDDVSVNAELIRQGMAWEYSLNRSNREPELAGRGQAGAARPLGAAESRGAVAVAQAPSARAA